MVALALLGTGATMSPAFSVAPDQCPSPTENLSTETVPQGTDVVECDLVGEILLSEEGAAIEIPAPGEAVTLTADLVDGSVVLDVETSKTGELTYTAATESAGSGDIPDEGDESGERLTVDVNGCNNDDYGTTPGRRNPSTTYRYRFGDGARPAGLSSAGTLNIIFASFSTWGNSVNNCGLADSSSVSYYYAGTTTLEADVSTTAVACTARDNTSVIDFGNLENGTVGIHCGWRNSNDVYLESDIRLNTTDFPWTTTPRSTGCTNHRDVQSTLTHEIGHAFGLADIYSSPTRYQTMHGTGYKCTRYKRTLARGDVRGLNALY